MAPRLQDESMRAYDAANIPGLRRPRTPDQRVARLVSEGGEKAAERLVRLIAVKPNAALSTARELRKHLAGTSQNPEPKLYLLDQLVRTCPYFYRFIANPRFFSTLWAVHKAPNVSPDARTYVLVLVRAWAEDLAAMFFRRSDPPAAFWVERYDRKRRYTMFPDLPKGSNRPYVCRVSAGNKRVQVERGHVMNREELEASLLLLDRLLAAAESNESTWSSISAPVHELARNMRRAQAGLARYDENTPHSPLSDPSATLKLAKKAPAKAGGASALNEKVMAVLRRYDESFARFDPYLSTPHGQQRSRIRCPDVFGETEEFPTMQASCSSMSTMPSVAAVAREKARWKLSLTASSSTLESSAERTSGEGSEDANLYIPEEPVQNSVDALSFPAVTPATFANVQIIPEDEEMEDDDSITSSQACAAAHHAVPAGKRPKAEPALQRLLGPNGSGPSAVAGSSAMHATRSSSAHANIGKRKVEPL